MKRVCLVDYDMAVTGGVEQVTASLANTFCGDYQVFLCEINHSGPCAYDLDERVHFQEGMKGKTRLREMIRGFLGPFIRFVKEHKIDVVLMMGNYPALIVSFTRFFTKARYIYCDHGALMNQWDQKDITGIRRWVSWCAHKTVVLTEKTRQDYLEKFHIRPGKIRCIYNWVEDEVAESRRPYQRESRKILSVGRFGKEKGYDLLVKVAGQVLPEYPQWSWDIYGAGETFEETKEAIRQAGLEGQICLKGNVKEAYRFYGEYAFLVLPSYREGLPIVLLEAGALGIPMVSFDIETGPGEIILEGENGFLIPPYDVEGMAEKIRELIRDPDLRERLASYEGTREKFSKEKILREWIKVLEE